MVIWFKQNTVSDNDMQNVRQSVINAIPVITLESCPRVLIRLCFWFFCLIFSCLCILSCVFMFCFPCPHVSFKFSCVFSHVLPSGSLCLLYCSLHVLSCAPPPRYLTCWSTSPVPRLVISVCVFSLCVPFTSCPVIVCILFTSIHVGSCSCFKFPHGMFWF